MSLSYVCLRQLHFQKSMTERFQGLGRTAITVVAFFGTLGVLAIAGIVFVLANGLMALTSPQTAPVERLSVVLSWQLAKQGSKQGSGCTFPAAFLLARPANLRRSCAPSELGFDGRAEVAGYVSVLPLQKPQDQNALSLLEPL